jgi:ABC-type Fe3+-hydroxamate transport system substrate-binding protein
VDKKVIAIVPELDDYLQPDEARQKFAVVPHAHVIGVDGAKHLWVGESATKRVLDEIVRVANPSAFPLPEVWNG